ncbi:MAG: alpha/beta hydrolase-fold protein [Noviherbaspirillum sp.]
MALVLAASALSLLGGCAFFPKAKDRLDMLELRSSCSPAPATLLVMLPGRYDAPQDLIDKGFARAVEQRGIDADIIIPDLHFGYYIARTAVDRLHQDVIAPARARGYRNIRLVGISVGGLGALLYAQAHPGLVDELVLLAPYLGESGIHQEIARAGGFRAWDPGQWRAEDFERNTWAWLKQQDGAAPPVIRLGYGVRDGFAMSNRLLAAALPQDRVNSTAGGHDWAPWLRLWETVLDQGSAPACVRTAWR